MNTKARAVAEDKPPELDPEEVLQWLAAHPNFLATFPEVLEHMLLPHHENENGTLSFQTYQAQRLQARNQELEACLEQGQRNERLIDHILLMVAEILEDNGDTLQDMLTAHEERLNRHFPAAVWAIRLLPEIANAPDAFLLPEHTDLQRAARTVFRKGSESLSSAEAATALWPEQQRDTDVLILSPLKRKRRYGVLCRTVTEQELDDAYGFVLLTHVASCIAATLERFCALAEDAS